MYLLQLSSLLPDVAGESQFQFTQTPATPAWPLQVSGTYQSLVDQNGVHFLIVGDSCWEAPINVSLAAYTTYLEQRRGQGFNTVFMTMFTNAYGGGRADYSTYDGVYPFTGTVTGGSLDLATPNATYWARVDSMIAAATQLGFLIILIAFEADNGSSGNLPLLRANGTAKATAYGSWLATRYQNYKNIIWGHGVDFQTWTSGTTYADYNSGTSSTDNQLVTAVMAGINSVLSGAPQTIELDYQSSASVSNTADTSYLALNWVYDQWPQYDLMLTQYAALGTNHIPHFMGEGDYEGENNTGRDPSTSLVLRKQFFWSALTGGTGQMFGNHYTWQFLSGYTSNVQTAGADQFIRMSNFIGSLPWWSWVPDTTHVVLTSGYGTYVTTGSSSITLNDYATTVRTSTGSLVVSYLPTSRAVTYDMTKLSGTAKAYWFDPTNGTYTFVGSFANTGTHTFAAQGNNAGGDPDWVLLLTT